MERCIKLVTIERLKVGDKFREFKSPNGHIMGPLLEVVSVKELAADRTQLEYKWADTPTFTTELPSWLGVCGETSSGGGKIVGIVS